MDDDNDHDYSTTIGNETIIYTMLIFILAGGFGQDVDSQLLYSTFLPFGEILDVQLPPDPTKREFELAHVLLSIQCKLTGVYVSDLNYSGDKKQHRGFGFVTFSINADALDAVDNMHLNELNGRVSFVLLFPFHESNIYNARLTYFLLFPPTCVASQILKVNLAKPMKAQMSAGSNRAGEQLKQH